MKTYKRLLSALLVLLMCVSLFPVSAFAADEAADAAEAVESVEPAAEPAEEAEEPAAEPAEEIAPQDVEPEDDEGEVAIATDGPTLTGATGTKIDEYDGYYTYRVEIDPGETKTLSVTASGDGLTYAWTAGGNDLNQHGSSITATCSSGGPLQYNCYINDSNNNSLTVTFQFLVNSPMYLADAAGDWGNEWSPEGRPDITNWNSYQDCEPGDTVELWVQVGGLSDAEMEDVTYKWTDLITGEDTDEHGAAFPSFVIGDKTARYQCTIRDGYDNFINVVFDAVIPVPPLPLLRATGNRMYEDAEIGYYEYAVDVEAEEQVYLFVEADGENLDYSWYDEDGLIWEAVDGITVLVQKGSPTQYSCSVADESGSSLTVSFILNVHSDLALTGAKGYCYNEEQRAGYYLYNYSVGANPGEEVSLWVEIDDLSGEEPNEVTYKWFKSVPSVEYEGWEYAETGETTSAFPAFTMEEEHSTYKCEIMDSYGSCIWVVFDVNINSGPGPGPGYDYVTPEPFYGTTLYRTAAGLPVDLRVVLPEGCTEEDYTKCVWSYMVFNENTGTYRALATTEEPQLTVAPTTSTQYMLYINGTNKRFDRVYFTVDVVPGGMITTMDQDYYALAPGDEITVYGPTCPPYWCAESTWRIENETPADGNDGAVIAPNPDGSSCAITAIGEGTAFVTWELRGTDESGVEVVYAKLRCRIDVAAVPLKDAVTGITIPNTAATTELYSTSYSRVEILLDLENNLGVQSQPDDRNEPESGANNVGPAIVDAWFIEEAAREHFTLRAVDDRTLEIIPNIDFAAPREEIDAAVKAVAKSYKSGIAVLVKGADEAVESSQQLTLTVKKTLPKLTAKAVKFNSFISGDQQFLSYSSVGMITDLRENPEKPKLDWVGVSTRYTEDGAPYYYLEYTGARNAGFSGKLYLLATVDRCAVELPLVVSVKAAKSAPKLKVNGTVTINPTYYSDSGTWINVTPPRFDYEPMAVTKITEGNTTWPSKEETLDDAPIACFVDGYYNEWTFNASIRDPDTFESTKDRTFKVTVDLGGATTTVTVKTLKAETKPTLKLKAAGTVDTMIPGSPVTLTWTGTSLQGMQLDFSVHQYKGKADNGKVEPGLFSIYYSRGLNYAEISKVEGAALSKDYTYYVHADILNERGDTVLENAAKIKLNVKWSTSHAKISTSLKASGTIDLIRPNSLVTLKPGELKNCFTTSVSPQSLKFSTDKAGINEISPDALPFKITTSGIWNESRHSYMPVFNLMLKDECRGVVKTTEKFYVCIDMMADGQHVTTKPVQIKLTKGAAKITPTVKTVQLLKNDRFSYANIGLIAPDGCTPISDVTLDAKSDLRFDLVVNGGGNVELHRDPTNALTTKATVKLNVYLKGNTTGKPDATVSIAVKFA